MFVFILSIGSLCVLWVFCGSLCLHNHNHYSYYHHYHHPYHYHHYQSYYHHLAHPYHHPHYHPYRHHHHYHFITFLLSSLSLEKEFITPVCFLTLFLFYLFLSLILHLVLHPISIYFKRHYSATVFLTLRDSVAHSFYGVSVFRFVMVCSTLLHCFVSFLFVRSCFSWYRFVVCHSLFPCLVFRHVSFSSLLSLYLTLLYHVSFSFAVSHFSSPFLTHLYYISVSFTIFFLHRYISLSFAISLSFPSSQCLTLLHCNSFSFAVSPPSLMSNSLPPYFPLVHHV